ncbi:hypothetical protein T439DRAFT_356870 [Meredithblackwellia eburnea MCA 4105]
MIDFASHVERKVYPEERSTFDWTGRGENGFSVLDLHYCLRAVNFGCRHSHPTRTGWLAKMSTPPGSSANPPPL